MDEIQSIFQSLKLKHYVHMNINFECKIVNMICSPVLTVSLVLKRSVSLRRSASFEYLKHVFEIWYKYLKHFYLEVRYL